MKKLVSALLFICLFVGNVVPQAVFAEDSKSTNVVPSVTYTKEELALAKYEAAVQYLDANSVSLMTMFASENEAEQVYLDKLNTEYGTRVKNQQALNEDKLMAALKKSPTIFKKEVANYKALLTKVDKRDLDERQFLLSAAEYAYRYRSAKEATIVKELDKLMKQPATALTISKYTCLSEYLKTKKTIEAKEKSLLKLTVNYMYTKTEEAVKSFNVVQEKAMQTKLPKDIISSTYYLVPVVGYVMVIGIMSIGGNVLTEVQMAKLETMTKTMENPEYKKLVESLISQTN
ncbi:MAG: hypothetical protein ACRCWQ_15075 [Bacilli bacterium]